MAYVQVELDAIKDAQLAAGVLGISPAQVVGGLTQLWAHCWSHDSDRVSLVVLEGLFCAVHPRLVEVLSACGFLEVVDDEIRVRGAERYLRIAEGKRAGGKARSAAAKRRGGRFSAGEATSSQPAGHQQPPALTPITDPPITEHRSKDSEAKHMSAGADPPAAGVEDLRALWNVEADPALPRWQATGTKRGRAARARLREHPDLAYWQGVIARISASAFCRGLTGGTWRASPDWLVAPDTAAKVCEGKYDDTGPPPVDLAKGRIPAEGQDHSGPTGEVKW